MCHGYGDATAINRLAVGKVVKTPCHRLGTPGPLNATRYQVLQVTPDNSEFTTLGWEVKFWKTRKPAEDHRIFR
jgi:hypothetical protein